MIYILYIAIAKPGRVGDSVQILHLCTGMKCFVNPKQTKAFSGYLTYAYLLFTCDRRRTRWKGS